MFSKKEGSAMMYVGINYQKHYYKSGDAILILIQNTSDRSTLNAARWLPILSSTSGRQLEFLNLLLEPQVDQGMRRDASFFGRPANGLR